MPRELSRVVAAGSQPSFRHWIAQD